MAEQQLQLTLVRHGETDWSLSGQHTGRTDLPLNDQGREHARWLTDRLGGTSFDAVYGSPLKRAWETVAIAGLEAQAQPDPDLMEWDYGAFEGRTTPEIAAERGGHFSIWQSQVPGGESIEQVSVRADAIIQRLLHRGGRVALFSHGHFLRILTARWIEQPPQMGSRWTLKAAAVCELGYERQTRVVRSWNQVPG